MKKKFTEEELTAFRVFGQKGPVSYPTSQAAAAKAFTTIQKYLTGDERSRLSTAQSHAVDVGEGRREFDNLWNKVKVRLRLD